MSYLLRYKLTSPTRNAMATLAMIRRLFDTNCCKALKHPYAREDGDGGREELGIQTLYLVSFMQNNFEKLKLADCLECNSQTSGGW